MPASSGLARRPKWVAQTQAAHACCLPIAALNALRFYGRRSDIEPGHPGRDQWVGRWGCRHGAATGVDALLNGLGLRRVPMPFTLRAVQEALGLGMPVLLNLTHDSSGVGFHSALVVAVDGDRVLVINPHGARGPVEKWMPWSSLTFATGSPDPAMRNQALLLVDDVWGVGGPVISDYTRLGEYLREPGSRIFPAPQGCNPPADRVAFWLAAGHQNRDAVRAAIPPHKRTAWIAVDEVFRMFEEHAPLPTRERDVLAALRTWADGEGVAVSPTRQREIYIPPDWTQDVRWLNVQTALKTTAILMAEQPTTLRRLIAAASDIIWLIVLALVRRPEGYPQPSDQREEVAQWLACWEQRLHERLRFVVPTRGDVVRGPLSADTTRAALEAELGPLEFVNSGAYGEVWRTGKGTVVKTTSSNAEKHCVEEIQMGRRSPWLPEIYQSGSLRRVRFTYCPEDPEDEHPDCPRAPYSPMFWYEREDVRDLPEGVVRLATDIYWDGYAEARKQYAPPETGRKAKQWSAALRLIKQIRAAVRDLVRDTGLAVVDAKPRNWGTTADGRLVFRDLACGTQDMMWSEHDQTEEAPAEPWPPRHHLSRLRLPKEVGVSPGEPVAYHGGTYNGGPFRGSVLYLATTPEMAESYVDMHGDEAGALREFRVRLRNPTPKAVVFAAAEAVGIDPTTYTPASVFDAALQGDDEVAALVDDLRRQGYDGAILEDIAYGAEIAEPVYVVFDWRAVEPVAGGEVGGARVPVQHRRRARINRELQSAPAAVRALVRELGQALGDKRGGRTLEAIANARDAGAPDLKSAVLAALQQARGTDIKDVILAEALRLRPPGRLVHVIDLAENLKGMGYSGPQIKAGLHDLAMAGRIEMHPWTGGVHDVPHLDAFPHFGHARMMGRPHYQGYFHVLEGPSTGVVSGPAQSDVVERIRELLEDYTDPKWGAGHCANLALAVQRVLAQHGITAVIEMDWHEGREGTLDTPRSPLADGYFGGNHVRARVGDVVLDSPPGWKLARMITNPANFDSDFSPWEFRPATVEQIEAADVCVSKAMITRIANKLKRDLGSVAGDSVSGSWPRLYDYDTSQVYARAAATDNHGYTVTVVAHQPDYPKPPHGSARGVMYLTAPSGETLRQQFWLDWPEEGFPGNEDWEWRRETDPDNDAIWAQAEWFRIPLAQRAMLEAQRQVAAYMPLPERFADHFRTYAARALERHPASTADEQVAVIAAYLGWPEKTVRKWLRKARVSKVRGLFFFA